jgi:hypothetical protein
LVAISSPRLKNFSSPRFFRFRCGSRSAYHLPISDSWFIQIVAPNYDGSGIARGIEIELRIWWKLDTNRTGLGTQLPILVRDSLDVKIGAIRRSEQRAARTADVDSSTSAFHDCGGCADD